MKADYSRYSLGDIVAELGETENCAFVLEQELENRYPVFSDWLPGLYKSLRDDSTEKVINYPEYIRKLVDSEKTFEEIVTF